MLQYLHVKNLALIEESEIYFEDGLNILSGETGAGKSILIDSLNFALGGKLQKEMIRRREDEALVEALFDLRDDTVSYLSSFDIPIDDNQILLQRRVQNGHNTCKVNGETVTAMKLREISAFLIDIHGQHEHQSLLQKKRHLEILDTFAGEKLNKVMNSYKEAYQSYKDAKKALEEASMDEESRKKEIALLEFEVQELQNANLKPGEDEELEASYKKMSNGKEILKSVGLAAELLSGDQENAADFVSRAYKELEHISVYDDSLSDVTTQLSDIDQLLTDVSRDLRRYLDSEDFDEETFFEVENRYNELNHLKTKYGMDISRLLESLEEKEERLDFLNHMEEHKVTLKKQMEHCYQALYTIGEKITEIRKKSAKELQKKICIALEDLNFLNVSFEMEFHTLVEPGAKGLEDGEFLISLNPGEPLRSLSKIASGGELSRIMLALKTIQADSDEIESLIFDEIDTGISGRTAQAVSEKLNVVAKNHQVICITHLPQIAAMADQHYLIEKNVEDNQTISQIKKLNDDEIIKEIARMLGGIKITDTVLESAKEMKELATQSKG